MRKNFAALLIVAPLLAACGGTEQPLIPELKGRWDMADPAKIQKMRAERGLRAQTTTADVDSCKVAYLTFSKHAVVMRMMGISLPLFPVADVKRDGQRLILTGGSDSSSLASHGKLVLLLRNGEVRFDDLLDEHGRSMKYARLPDESPMRRQGMTTFGEAFGMLLDVKPCKA